MKITMAQLNPTVGDIEGNIRKIKEVAEIAHTAGADLAVFPEMFLAGYPPRDLLEKTWFIEKTEKATQELTVFSSRFKDTGLLIGTPLRGTQSTGKGLYNSALLIYDGKQVFAQHKSLLPNYDVFDELRYFDVSHEISIFPFKNEKLGIMICEDAWYDAEFWPGGRMYPNDPVAILAEEGATIFINISASPYTVAKEETRFHLIANHAKKHRMSFLYVNQVGGNDELIFDGRSLFVDKQGRPVHVLPPFQEHVKTVETDEFGEDERYQPQDRIESVYHALCLGIKDYMRKCGFKRAVVGLSGGIDSSVTLCLVARAIGSENVLGISMPSQFSSEGSLADSRRLAENLDVEYRVIPITDVYQSYLKTLQDHFKGRHHDTTEENLQARIRGNILMAFSNKYGYLVLSTGNKSELAVGYCTLYGDMSGGLAVISDVPKTMVYDLAYFINKIDRVIPESVILKAPSAELRPDQKDEDSLPPYPDLDRILNHLIEGRDSVEDIIKKGFDAEVVKWVARAVALNEYKRKQAAPGLKVTTKAFGVGRRIPIAAHYTI
jgi:NAD+ synthase (glutamine-hydrolysing)